MAYAVSIRSDNDTCEPIRLIWETCGALEASPSMEALNYAPHITLTIYDDMEVSRLLSVFDFAVCRLDRTRIRFESLSYFEDADRIVLWAVPTLPDTIRAVQTLIHSRIDPNLCRPHYRPDSWVPHCSLATTIALSRRAEAIALANRPIEPFEVDFDVADCISFPPVRVLDERDLPGTA